MPTGGFHLSRAELAAYAACAVLVVLLGWRVLHADGGSSAGGGGAPLARASTVTSASASPAAAGGAGATVSATPPRAALVHVVGAVHHAGVYRLPTGARVQDAIAHAGGATASADLQAINLAAKIADGQQVIVPRHAARTVAPPGPAAEQLDTLDGVGPATAQKILAFRTAHGGFASVDDLSQIPGIGPKKLEALRPQVTA